MAVCAEAPIDSDVCTKIVASAPGLKSDHGNQNETAVLLKLCVDVAQLMAARARGTVNGFAAQLGLRPSALCAKCRPSCSRRCRSWRSCSSAAPSACPVRERAAAAMRDGVAAVVTAAGGDGERRPTGVQGVHLARTPCWLRHRNFGQGGALRLRGRAGVLQRHPPRLSTAPPTATAADSSKSPSAAPADGAY